MQFEYSPILSFSSFSFHFQVATMSDNCRSQIVCLLLSFLILTTVDLQNHYYRLWSPFLESPGNWDFSGPYRAIAKSRSLRSQSCLIPIFLIRTEVPFIQEVSNVYTSLFLDTNHWTKTWLYGPQKISGAFEKLAWQSFFLKNPHTVTKFGK